MGERTGYAPGTFCWVELATTDPPAAKDSYAGVFGWEALEVPVGDGGAYTMLRLGGKDVGALQEQPQEQRRHTPPNWLSYVDDVEVTAARAGELGGGAVVGPLDVVDAGRMAVVTDPQGAVLALWEPGRHFGAGLVNDPGALTLNQLNTTDRADAQRLLEALRLALRPPAPSSRTTGGSTTAMP